MNKVKARISKGRQQPDRQEIPIMMGKEGSPRPKKAEGGPPEAPKLRNPVCGKERMGQYHAPGHEEEPRGGRGGTCPQMRPSAASKKE